MTFTEAMAAVEHNLSPEVGAAILDERERLYCAIQDAERYLWQQRAAAAHAVLERTLSDSELTEL